MNIVTGILMLTAAGAIAVITVYLVRMAHQVTLTTAQVERLARTLNESTLPRVERVLEQAEAQLGEMRVATQSAERVILTVRDGVDRAHEAVMPIVDAVGQLGGAMKYVGAVSQGIRAGVSLLRRPRG